MIGRFLLAAWSLVDPGAQEAVGRVRRGQEVVDPEPLVARPAALLAVPERVFVRLGIEGAVGVGPALMEQGAEPRAAVALAPGLRRSVATFAEGR